MLDEIKDGPFVLIVVNIPIGENSIGLSSYQDFLVIAAHDRAAAAAFAAINKKSDRRRILAQVGLFEAEELFVHADSFPLSLHLPTISDTRRRDTAQGEKLEGVPVVRLRRDRHPTCQPNRRIPNNACVWPQSFPAHQP